MANSRYTALFVLLLATAIFVGETYRTGSTGAFIGALIFLALLAVAPWTQKTDGNANEKIREATREFELEKMRLLMEQQKESGKLLIRRDLELSRANEQLRALDQLKTDFITVATHQLRTPLTAIRWLISMFLRGDLGELTDEQKTYLMKVYESNNRMIALLSDMLISDQISSEKLRVNPMLTSSFPDLADNVLTEIKPLAEKRHIRLIFADRKESYSRVRIDPRNMRAILQNLLENAIKYTNAGGSVTLSIREQAGSVVCSVADTGIGIPLPEQKNVFRRFFRARNAIQMETDGTGLGLYIVKGIVEKFKGEISFESKVNEGTTFRIVLPTAPTAAGKG